MGTATNISLNINTTPTQGSYQWLAPETIVDRTCNIKSDIFSLGTTIWEIASQQIPFVEKQSSHEIQQAIIKLRMPPVSNEWNPIIKEVIQKCWQNDPKKRPTTFDILLHISVKCQSKDNLFFWFEKVCYKFLGG